MKYITTKKSIGSISRNIVVRIMTFLLISLGGFRSNRSSNRLVSSFVTTTTNHIFGRTNRINNNPSASTALFSSKSDNNSNKNNKKSNANNANSRKIKINPNWKTDVDKDALSKAFDDLATSEGFDNTLSFYDDEEYAKSKKKELMQELGNLDIDGDDECVDIDEEDILLANYEISDDDDDDTIDGSSSNASSSSISMADRIAAAQQDLNKNKVTSSSFDLKPSELRDKIGLKYEAQPFGNDETPRNPNIYKLISNALNCPACGAKFQSASDEKPGFIPETKLDVQTKLNKIEQAKKEFDEKKSREWSADDEVDYLLSDSDDKDDEGEEFFNANAMAKELNLNLDVITNTKGTDTKAKKPLICQRCHNLQNYGTLKSNNLRPGYSDSPLLSQENFINLLKPITNANDDKKRKSSVIIVLVDLFDFAGSILPQLDEIVGPNNPVIIAANKADLLPKQTLSSLRIETWVRSELSYLGINCINNKGGAVRLISCKNGYGIVSLIEKAKSLVKDSKTNTKRNIYVIGAANAGKSTFMNYFLDKEKFLDLKAKKKNRKIRKGDTNAKKGTITTSPLPGTTLEFIKVDLSGKFVLYDTPGLLIPGTLTHLLTPEELKMVVPRKPVEAVTFRLEPGKCVQVGGLARIELKENSKPFLFTFFISNEVKLHVTDTRKVHELLSKHLGDMLLPPLLDKNSTSTDPIQERLDKLGEFEYHDLDVQGQGWKEAAVDIALRGLGWVAVTGPGVAHVRVSVPKGIGVSVRPPLMPYDIWKTTAKYTGSRAVRKGGKMMSGKARSGIGRR